MLCYSQPVVAARVDHHWRHAYFNRFDFAHHSDIIPMIYKNRRAVNIINCYCNLANMKEIEMTENIIIRKEKLGDITSIRAVNEAAFSTGAEARLVDQLRAEVKAEYYLSLVAEYDGNIVGHILFIPVSVATNPDKSKLLGLAPMGVVPKLQRMGIGSKLVEAGLRQSGEKGCHGVVVLGHPEYYPRFGFVPAHTVGLKSPYDVPEEAFMVKELKSGALANCSGMVRYHRMFDTL